VPAENRPGHRPDQEQDKPDLSAVARELGIPPEDASKAAERRPDDADDMAAGTGPEPQPTAARAARATEEARRALRSVPAGVGSRRSERADPFADDERNWYLPLGIATGAVRVALLPARAGLAVTRASLTVGLRVVERAERTLGSIGSTNRPD
jgi:hypothetical protein